MSNIEFYIWGFSGEGILGPLALHLQSKEYKVIHTDGKEPISFENIPGVKRVLLTSNHYTRTKYFLKRHYPSIEVNEDFSDLIDKIKPDLTVYYPHDFADPFVLNELDSISTFDLVLWPSEHLGKPRTHIPIIDVGWINHRKSESPIKLHNKRKACWFVSSYVYDLGRLKKDKYLDKLSKVGQLGVAIKLPVWKNHQEIENELKQRGVEVIDAYENTFATMQACDIVISNSLSGITFEADLLGKTGINLVEDFNQRGAQSAYSTHYALTQSLSDCRCVNYSEIEAVLNQLEQTTTRESRLPLFDFDLALSSMVSMLK